MGWEFSRIDQQEFKSVYKIVVSKSARDKSVEFLSFVYIPFNGKARPLVDFIADLESVVKQLKDLDGAK